MRIIKSLVSFDHVTPEKPDLPKGFWRRGKEGVKSRAKPHFFSLLKMWIYFVNCDSLLAKGALGI